MLPLRSGPRFSSPGVEAAEEEAELVAERRVSGVCQLSGPPAGAPLVVCAAPLLSTHTYSQLQGLVALNW